MMKNWLDTVVDALTIIRIMIIISIGRLICCAYNRSIFRLRVIVLDTVA
jgi:hypothetical protein